MDNQKLNKPLFSQHYLQNRIQASPEWQINVAADFQKLKKLYLSKQDLLPTFNEAQTEEVFIKPALDILGFSHIPQVTTRGKGRAERPDYALFNNENDRDSAYPLQNNETAFYNRVIAIAEAKYWERPLSKVSANDKRDIYKNENPSFQIASYLTGTGVDWGILTNGREWRLYYRLASSTATEFYHIDLVDILQTEDLEQFKYFWLFFRQAAFIKDAQGKNFLERVREGSNTYATRVGNELKALVFDSIFPDLAKGFVSDANRRGETVTSAQVYEATLSFLYKLLFLLYAEARNLLPIDSDYRDHSLIKLTQEIAQAIEKQKKLSQTSTGMYDKLLSLFQIVDRGDAGLEVPRYNGGLFHFDFQQKSQQIEYPANYFLFQFKICDAILAPVLDKLARFEGQPIDYSFLGVRQLGSIYEGLLEYRLKIDQVEAGSPTNNDSSKIAGKNPPSQVSVHLENDKGERKATGSYYTPEYIVKYIVSHTIKPILEQRQARFSELMAQISDLHSQMQDKRLGVQSINGLRKKLQRLEREAQSTLLDIKICDPAMGSGHFLVEAVDYLTDELISILTQYPEHNPVLEMLDQTRESILENLQQQGIKINADKLEPTQLLQRVVMKRCIYGVDLNPMAVELAKVSLWLHSFTIGAPLSFLDHHLRCGNSLIGTTAKEAEAKMTQEESGQLSLLTGPFVGLLKAAEIMRGVSVLSDATFAEVEESERLFRSFDEAAKPYKRLLDVYVAQFFGVKQAKNYLQRLGVDAITANPEKMENIDKTVYEEAQKLAEEKLFFHWDLEFPEVFIDLENASWKENAGFDGIVGNPPYVRVQILRQNNKSSTYYFSAFFKSAKGSYDLYMLIAERCHSLLNSNGFIGLIIPNKFLTSSYGETLRKLVSTKKALYELIDFTYCQVFAEVTTYICLLFLAGKECEYSKYLKIENLEVINTGILDFFSVRNDSLSEKAWIFSGSEKDKILSGIKLISDPLGQVASRLFQGIRTSSNEVYVLRDVIEDGSYIEGFSTALRRRVRVEKSLCFKFINGDEIQRYQSSSVSDFVIMPYVIEDDSFQLIALNEIKNKYPLLHKYFIENENLLKSREKGRLSETDIWHGFIYPKNIEVVHQPKIITRDIINHVSYTFDATGDSVFVTGYGIILNNKFEYSTYFVLAILNSALGDFALKQLNTFVRGGYVRIFTQYLEPIPIRRIGFNTPLVYRQQALRNLIRLYQEFPRNYKPNNLLTQVYSYLNQQPEEADVIHDLLAYLAEQMLELNKQKQTEIKSFLQWLERFISCPIDTLTNKSKIQNYLGDYYKQQPHLSFDELIEVLKKNKKKLKIDPVARKEQETLEKEYQASLETLLPIKMQLTRCDQLIDRIVYQLYGLTEEEIAIVEGK